MGGMHFGKWLKAHIEERMLSQTEFAVASKIEFWTLRNWLKSAEPSITGKNRVKLAAALKISREELERLLGLAPITTTAQDGVPDEAYVLKVPMPANEMSFLAPRYPGEEVIAWASKVLSAAIVAERSAETRKQKRRSRARKA